MSPHVTPLGPAHYAPLVAFLEQHSSGCFCQFWHFEGDDYGWQLRCGSEPEKNQQALQAALVQGHMRGVVVLANDTETAQTTQPAEPAQTTGPQQVLGWLQLCPAEQLHKLTQRRVYRTLPSLRAPASGTFRIGCMLVAPAWRGQGLAHALLREAIDYARTLGAHVIEAFPRCSETPLRADELWMGPAQSYAAMGFSHVDGPDGYPVMQLQL